MNIFIFSTLIVSIIFLMVLGSWYNIQGPFLLHVVLLIAAAVAIFSVAIVVAIQPLLFSRSARSRHNLQSDLAWGKEVSDALSSPAAVLEGYIVKFVNTPFLQALGMVGMADQIIGLPFTNLIHPADHQNFAELCAEVATGKIKNESSKMRLLSADGTVLRCNASLARTRDDNLNNLTLFQFMSFPLINSLNSDFDPQFKYHSIVDTLDEIVFQLNAEGKIIFLNPAWEQILEYKTQDCINKLLIDFFHPEDRFALEGRIASLTHGKRSSCVIEARLLSMRGDPCWIVMRAKTTSLCTGEQTSVVGTMTNIQNNKEAEATQIASRRAANSLLSNIPGMVYRGRNDHFWTFEFVSDGCIEVTGYDPQELINDKDLNYNLIIHPDDRAAVRESVNQQISNNGEFKLIYRIITRKGEIKLVQEHGRCILSSTAELLALEGFITEIPNQSYSVVSH